MVTVGGGRAAVGSAGPPDAIPVPEAEGAGATETPEVMEAKGTPPVTAEAALEVASIGLPLAEDPSALDTETNTERELDVDMT